MYLFVSRLLICQDIIIPYTAKSIFQYNIFYSPCPYLDGIKDVFCYKFRRLTIGQNGSAMCTDKGDHMHMYCVYGLWLFLKGGGGGASKGGGRVTLPPK